MSGCAPAVLAWMETVPSGRRASVTRPVASVNALVETPPLDAVTCTFGASAAGLPCCTCTATLPVAASTMSISFEAALTLMASLTR